MVILGELNFGPVQAEIAQSCCRDPGPGGLMLPGPPPAGKVHLFIPPAHQLRCGVQALLALRLVAWFVDRWGEVRSQPLAEEVEGDELHLGDEEQAPVIAPGIFVAPPIGAAGGFSCWLRSSGAAHVFLSSFRSAEKTLELPFSSHPLPQTTFSMPDSGDRQIGRFSPSFIVM